MFTIDEIKEKATPIAIKYGIDSLSIFGSYARGDQNENSDIDFLMDKGSLRGLFEYVGFYQELEDIFKCHVDVVSSGIDDKDFINKISKEKRLIYARK